MAGANRHFLSGQIWQYVGIEQPRGLVGLNSLGDLQ